MNSIVYFLNHLVDPNMNSATTWLQGIVFIGIPGIIALSIILVLMRLVRCKKGLLILLIIVLYALSIILPLWLVIRSLIFLNMQSQIVGWIGAFLIFGMLYWAALQYYYPKYLYKTDAEYLKSIPDGRSSIVSFPHPLRLQVLNIIYSISFLLIAIGGVLFFSGDRASNANPAFVVCAIGGAIWLLFLVWFRWWVRCPVCNSTVYGGKKENNKTYFICTMLRIFRYHRFTCMYCYAHIRVGKRDIIAEKNLEIVNMHQPDFQVKKRVN